MAISHFLPFATAPVLHSEFMPLKLTQTPKEELKPFLTNLGTAMRAIGNVFLGITGFRIRFSLFPSTRSRLIGLFFAVYCLLEDWENSSTNNNY